MKKIFLLLALAAVAALIWHARQEPAQLVASASVVRTDIAAILSVEGKTRLKARYQIAAPVAGQLRRITLEPGDSVNAGDVLAIIDPADAALLDARSHEQARAELAAAEALLAAAEQRIDMAQAAETLAHQELARLQPLVKSGAATREQQDRARAEQRRASADHRAAHADADSARAKVSAAQAQLHPAHIHDSAHTIRAPIAGKIIQRALQSAQPVAAGQILMEIGDPQALEIEAEVLSADAARLAPGMSARLLRWGGDTLSGHIARIEPGGFTKVSALGVEEQRTRVILAIDSSPEAWQTLGDGYRVDLDIITEQVKNALALPVNALFRHDNGWAVYAINAEQRAELRPVRLGLQGETHVQLLEGVAENERVILQPDAKIRPGSKIDSAE